MPCFNFRTKQVLLNIASVPYRLVGVNPSRRRFVIVVPSGANVYLDGDNTVSSSTGFLVPTGYPLVIKAQGEIWATQSGGAVSVSCLEEF